MCERNQQIFLELKTILSQITVYDSLENPTVNWLSIKHPAKQELVLDSNTTATRRGFYPPLYSADYNLALEAHGAFLSAFATKDTRSCRWH